MKKSEQKEKTKAKKNETRRKKHSVKVLNQLGKREEKQNHYLNEMVKKTQATVEQNSKDERIKDQLRHNMEILEALEKQMSDEEKAKAQVNADLESKGLKTLEEKMDYLHKQAAEMHQKENLGLDHFHKQAADDQEKEALGLEGHLRETVKSFENDLKVLH
jgi:hypothetical protein